MLDFSDFGCRRAVIAAARVARRVTEALRFSRLCWVSGACGPAGGTHPVDPSPRGGWEGSGAPGQVY